MHTHRHNPSYEVTVPGIITRPDVSHPCQPVVLCLSRALTFFDSVYLSTLMAYRHPQSLVLNNLDLLEQIFDYLSNNLKSRCYRYPAQIDPEIRRDLLSAALTSKSFLEPAITLLWRNMESIWPLFLILPVLKKGRDRKCVSVFHCMCSETRHHTYYRRSLPTSFARNTFSAYFSMPAA